MALTDEGNSGIPATMLVGPASYAGGGQPYPVYMGGQQGGSGNGNGWDNGWWIILLFILLASGRWGDYGNNNGGGSNGGMPIIVNDGNGGSVQRGFDQASIMGGINQIQNGVQGLSTQLCGCCCDTQNTVNQGFAGVQQSLCNGFAGVNQTVNGAQNAIAQQLYSNQIADMQQAFAAQTAMNQGFNQIGTRFDDCCCENRLASADLKYTIATENCADRAAISDGIRDIIANQIAGFQSIKDQLCQDKLDEKNDTIAQLRQEVLYARGQASQDVQTARLLAGQTSEVDALYNRLAQCPVPCMPVYGMTPIFTCNNGNNGCGCNGGNF